MNAIMLLAVALAMSPAAIAQQSELGFLTAALVAAVTALVTLAIAPNRQTDRR